MTEVTVGNRERKILGNPATLLAAIAIMFLIFGWGFLQDPTRSAQTRDPAWYTWRASILVEDSPASIVEDWGPHALFSGGYRVAVPMAGGILRGVAGIDSYSFSAILMIGIPGLTGLALGAWAYRHKRDPLILLITLFVFRSSAAWVYYEGERR